MKFLDRAYPLLLLAPVLLPVVVWNGVVYPYLVPKTLLFYTLSLVSLAAFLVLVAYGRPFFWGRLTRKDAWIPFALLVSAYLASFVGTDFYRSFWSLFIRGDGLLMLTGVVLSFYLILLHADRTFFERFLRWVAYVATFVALYGIGEWVFKEGDRIGGLLGNAAFFAGYLGMTIFFTLAAARSAPLATRQILLWGAGVQIIAIILSGTRGSMLALIVAGMIALVYRVFINGGDHSRALAVSALGVLVILGGAFFSFRAQLAHISFDPIARIASISLEDRTVANRLFVWENMIEVALERPWTGVGAEHIDILFNKIYDPTKVSEQWFDRSHNTFIDYFAQYGIVGLALYLSLLLSILINARRLSKLGGAGALFALLVVVYVLQNIFVFDTISSFWLLIALSALLIVVTKEEGERTALHTSLRLKRGTWVIAGVLILLIIPVSVAPMRSAYHLAHGYTYQLTDVAKEVAHFSHGLSLGTYGDIEYGHQVYDIYANRQHALLSGEDLAAAYEITENILTENFRNYPYDGRTALYLAHVLTSAPEGVVVEQEFVFEALERAIRLSPKRSQPWFLLTNLAIENANAHPPTSKERAEGYAGAYDLLTQYIALVPESATPYFVRAELIYASGDRERSLLDAKKGMEVYTPDVEAARRAVGFFIREEMLEEARFFLEEIVRLEPEDMLAQYDLAKALFLIGDKERALSIVNTLRTSDPSILESDEAFLQAITSYERGK
jgi:O-antigen ligase/tetratricopeptide (TPR) repeat protein